MHKTSPQSLHLRASRTFLAAAIFLGVGLQAAPSLPTGGNVVAGSGSVSAAGSTLTVTQSSAKLAVNWDSFNIGEGATVRFVQPSSSSVALNRVTGADASVIQGALTSNGHVFLLNPSGVLFAKTAQVSVGGLVASTLSLSNEDFLAGNYAFSAPGAGLVVNEGNLVAVGGGSVSLIAAQVVNSGTISAERGSVNLAAGSRVTLNLGGLVNVAVEEGVVDALVRNGGAIRADGGRVLLTARGAGELTAAAISNEGIIEARTLATGEQGEIRLLGGLTGGDAVNVAGVLDVSAPNGGNGGFVETSAAHINISDTASVNALAVGGKTGSWLIDPDFLEIVASAGVSVSAANAAVGGTSQVSVTTLSAALNLADVSLQAVNQIDFKVAFNHVGTQDATLTLLAPTIKMGGNITASGSKLGLVFGNGTTSAGNIFLYDPAGSATITRTLTTNGGDIRFFGNIGGAHDFVADAGTGDVRFSSTVDGSFTVWQLFTGTMAFSYQAGGGQGSVTTIDFSVPKVSFYDTGTQLTTDANQYNPVSKNGTTYPILFPKGYLVIPANAQIDFNAQQVPVTITHPDGTTDSTLVGSANGTVTFTSDTKLSKISFSQTNGSWTDIFAQGVSWMSDVAAGKPRNLTVKSGTTTIDAGRTISVDGDIRISAAKFVNNSGSTALTAGTNKNWQVWSSNPTPFDQANGDVAGSLPYDFKYYGLAYGTTAQLPSGNGMFYTYQPTIAATLVNTVTKVYNGNTASINLTNANYSVSSGAVAGDVVSFTGTMPTTGTYASKDVGSGISITSSVIPLSNISALSNTGKPVYGYGPNGLTATGSIGIITKKTLTSLTGITANDRDYNQGTGATLNTGAAVFGGKVSGDTLTIASATGTFSDKDSANGKTVTISGLTLGGTDAGNYDLPAGPFTTTASIFKLNISAVTGITAFDKVYDGNTTAILDTASAGFTGLLSGDILTVSSATGNFVDKNAGSGKTVNITGLVLGGLDAVNYNLLSANATTTAAITKKQLTSIAGLTADNKVYDGLTGAALHTGSPTFGGKVSGDTLTITSATGNFSDKDAANGKTVNVTGIVLGGQDANNYDLPPSVTTIANITKAPLHITANNHSVAYSGTGYTGGNGVTISGFVLLEGDGNLGGALAFSGSSQGAINGGTYVLTPYGYTSSNYDLLYANGTLTITGAPVVVDPHEFLPKTVVVPVYPIATPAVQMPMAVGGLNYVPVSAAGVPLAPTANGSATSDAASTNVASAVSKDSSGEIKHGQAADRIDRGVSRSIQGPTDILVVEGGVNLGQKPLSAE